MSYEIEIGDIWTKENKRFIVISIDKVNKNASLFRFESKNSDADEISLCFHDIYLMTFIKNVNNL